MNNHVNEVKFLGVDFDDKLKFDKFITNKINHLQGIRREIFKLKYKNAVTLKILVILYKVFIRSKLEYGLPALIMINKEYHAKLESFQHYILTHFLEYPRGINRKNTNSQCDLSDLKTRINHLTKNGT